MKKLKVVAGNCVVEDLSTSLKTAKFLKEISLEYNFDLIYKSSFKKDNRSSDKFFASIGINECNEIFKSLKKEYQLQIITDFHNLYELEHDIVKTVDFLQVPAYLCMQTELIIAMAKTGKNINIKKGQFLSPESIANTVKKIENHGNKQITITERGTCFGYRDLIVDPRSFQILKNIGYPVIFDACHSVRKYGVPSSDTKNGGSKEFIQTLTRSAIASDVDGIFVEVHPEPSNAQCDAATQLSFLEFENLMRNIIPLWNFVHSK